MEERIISYTGDPRLWAKENGMSHNMFCGIFIYFTLINTDKYRYRDNKNAGHIDTTRRVLVQRAVERDKIPYPRKVHDATLRPLLNIMDSASHNPAATRGSLSSNPAGRLTFALSTS